MIQHTFNLLNHPAANKEIDFLGGCQEGSFKMGLPFGQREIFSQSKQQNRRNTLCIARVCWEAMGEGSADPTCTSIFKLPRAVSKWNCLSVSERFFHRASNKAAGILCVLQGFVGKLWEKRSAEPMARTFLSCPITKIPDRLQSDPTAIPQIIKIM